MAHMVYAPLDMYAFNRWAGRRGLLRQGVFDEGYALHILLSSMFGKAALRPFRLFSSERRRTATLYAYADEDEGSLRNTAGIVASPDCLVVLDPAELLSKRVSVDFRPDQ